MEVPEFIHLPIKGPLSRFQALAIMNKATIDITCWLYTEVSFQLIWVNMQELDCYSKTMFSFVKKL